MITGKKGILFVETLCAVRADLTALAEMDVLTAALESIMTFVISKFVFKETVGRSTLIAFVLCAISMVINVL